MTLSLEDEKSLATLEVRLRTILPEEYQDFDSVQPASMGSADVKYGPDGKVAWDEIWGSFCDLAMAGGPPHKGTLLEPGSRVEIEEQPDRYRQVVEEIIRGIRMVTALAVQPCPIPGWVRIDCGSRSTAGWLVRAITMENVSVRCEGSVIDLPAGPGYRIEKEIKNVITVSAKTSHYWVDHMWPAKQREIGNLFLKLAEESPLVQPALSGNDFSVRRHALRRGEMAELIQQATGLAVSDHRYSNWLGFECPSVRAAVWMMRALIVTNVLSRREGTVLFVPLNPASDPGGETVVRSVARIHRLARLREVL